jgi:acyl-ACP thioesterase
MAETAAGRIVPAPPDGRIFTATRPVRFGDVNPAGRTRLDALSTYVQDVAGDDTAASGLGADLVWVVRRAVFVVQPAPRFLESLTLRTWCSGIGRRWAERRVEMRGDRGAAVDAAVLWVALDQRSNRPVALPPAFLAGAGPAAQGRVVSARLQHASGPAAELEVERRPWALRATDFDLLRHVNNAASWAMVEELLDDHDPRVPVRAEVEYRVAVEPGSQLELLVQRPTTTSFALWAVGRPAGADAAAEPIVFTTATFEVLAG